MRSRALEADRAAEPALRMRDLVRQSGLSRETIHFYLSEGLLPAARKAGRNTATYGPEHLDRLRLIRELKEKHFLPLRAIRAILDGEPVSEYTREQREVIEGVQARLAPAARRAASDRVPLTELLAAEGVAREDVREFERLGIVEVKGSGRPATVTREDARLIRLWARLQLAGISPERGFSARHAAILEQAIDGLVRDEAALFARLYAGVSPEEAARVVETAVPVLNDLLGALHWKRIRRFLAEFGANSPPDRRRPAPSAGSRSHARSPDD